MNGVAVCRKVVATMVVALSGFVVLAATSAPGAAAAGGCAGTAYVTNEQEGTVSVLKTATDAVSATLTAGKGAAAVAICPARSAHPEARLQS